MRLTGTPSWLSARQETSSSRKVRQEEPRPPTQVWAFGGGKGGIGKTFLAANLGATAALAGRRVVLVDLDLGGGNLHTCLGVRTGSRVNLLDYLDHRVEELEKVAIETAIPGLRLILGALSHPGAAETTRAQRTEMLRQIRALQADVVILDLSAGTERQTLDFFLASNLSFVVTTPEPTAIENMYQFLRAAYYRKLAHALSGSPVREVLRAAMDQRNERGIRTPGDLLSEVEKIDVQEAARFERVIADMRPRLIVNQVRNSDEVKLGFSLRGVCRKHLGINLDYVGYVNFDDCVWRSVKDRRLLVQAFPHSDGALYIRRIVKKLLEEGG